MVLGADSNHDSADAILLNAGCQLDTSGSFLLDGFRTDTGYGTVTIVPPDRDRKQIEKAKFRFGNSEEDKLIRDRHPHTPVSKWALFFILSAFCLIRLEVVSPSSSSFFFMSTRIFIVIMGFQFKYSEVR